MQESQHAKQQVASLQRHNCTLNTELNGKECVVSQLQLRVAVLEQGILDKEHVASQLQLRVTVLEQGISDKEHLVGQTKEVLKATREQKVSNLL